MRDFPLIYMDIAFFKAYIQKAKQFIELKKEEAEQILYIKNILETFDIKIDLSKDVFDAIKNCPLEDLELIETIANKFEMQKDIVYHIRLLMLKNPGHILFYNGELRKFKALEYVDLLPDALLLNSERTDAIEKKYGITCHNTTLNVSMEKIINRAIVIKKSEGNFLNKIFSKLGYSNTFIISDPYFFEEDLEGYFLLDLLHAMLKEKDRPATCLIQCNNKKGKLTSDRIKIIKDNVKKSFSNLIVDIEIRTGGGLHDRNIFTNNYWISADYGFLPKYTKKTKWALYPKLLPINYNDIREMTIKISHEFPTFNNLLN